MKFRNFIIVLLAVLMAFAFASCKHEPKEEPKPTPSYGKNLYQIEVTEGVDKDYWNRDKIKLEWEVPVKAGDVLTLKYRSERDVYQWDIRDGSLKWVYESKKGSFTDPVLGEDGWYTLTYTFANDINGAAVPSNSRFGVYFRGNFVTTDIFEIKDIFLNDEELEVEASNIKSYAQLNDPAEAFDWTVKNYTVLFATGTPGEVDKTPIAEKVVAGGLVTGAPIAKANYSLTIYTDTAHTSIFDPTTPITEEKIFYYEYVGDPRTVTFVTTPSASVIEPMNVHYNDLLTPPAEEPVLEGKAFKAWYKDAELTTLWDFATEHIEDNLTLYAGYGDPATVTFDAQNGEAEHATKIVAIGNAVAMPAEAPTFGSKMFLGWYTDAECTTAYVFSTPVEADITLYAGWVNATDVTLNLNYEGAPAATTFKAALDVALAADDENLKVVDDRIGYVFGGWYKDAECTTAYDYTEDVLTAPITLYAKWTEATLYRLVSTHDNAEDQYTYDKFTIQYKGEGAQLANAGNVLSFRYRSTSPITFMSIRGDKKWVYENDSATRGMTTYETKEDGWTYVTYVFAAKTYDASADIPADAWWRFDFGTRTVVKGDILEIQDWTFNGEPLAIVAANVTQYLAPTLSIVEGGAYEWGKRTVSFDTGAGAPIDPVEVDFDRAVVLPADPVVEGKAFAGWFLDAEFTKPFDAASFIIENTTLYAKYDDPCTVTFNGTDIAAVVVAKGNKVAKPADPAKAENVFGGWYADSEFAAEFDFSAAIEADTTIYAKWIPSWTVTLNLNYEGAPAATDVYVAKGGVMAAPKNPARVGYFFGGWYNDKACTEAHDFSAAVTADATIYAKWTEPTEAYLFTATVAEERFQFRWHEDSGFFADGQIKPGDVFTLMIKFPEGNSAAEKKWRLRTRSTEAHITEDVNFSSTPKEGDWYLITAVVPEGITGNGLYLQVYEAANAAIGDKMIIKAFAYNGTAIEVDARPYGTASTSKGAYSKVKADGSVVNPDGTPKAE